MSENVKPRVDPERSDYRTLRVERGACLPQSVHNSAKRHFVFDVFCTVFTCVQFSRRYGNMALWPSIRQIHERHKEEDPKNKTPVLKNQPVSVLLWRELHSLHKQEM